MWITSKTVNVNKKSKESNTVFEALENSFYKILTPEKHFWINTGTASQDLLRMAVVTLVIQRKI